MLTAQDCLHKAFAALLTGDLADRDRWCAMAETLIRAGERARAGGPIIEGEAIKVAPPVICLPDRSRETFQ